jgi:hypothetical protein
MNKKHTRILKRRLSPPVKKGKMAGQKTIPGKKPPAPINTARRMHLRIELWITQFFNTWLAAQRINRYP